MANPIGGKKLKVYDTRSVGEVVQSAINLETITNGQWIALDGRDCIRSQYPELSPYFPAGVFTSTARTLSQVPNVPVSCADSTNFYAVGLASSGNGNFQASADGITWTSGSSIGFGSTYTISSMIIAGSRIVAAGAGFVAAVANINQAAATVVGTGAWTTAASGGGVTTLTQGLAYGSTANAGAGRTVMCIGGALATASGLLYMNDGATSWTSASGGSTQDRTMVINTGQRFLAFSNSPTVYQSSNDGATWADNVLPFRAASASVVSAASDGAGTVVLYLIIQDESVNSHFVGFLVSKDHGVTWGRVVPGFGALNTGGNGSYLNFINGKFFLNTVDGGGVLVSVDGKSWQYEPIAYRASGTSALAIATYAYKNGVYCGIRATTTSALTATEDMSKFRLSSVVPMQTSPAGLTSPSQMMNSYIKARSN